MNHDRTTYEVRPQQESEANLGASINWSAQTVADEDDIREMWSEAEQMKNTALLLTQIGLDGGIEMMVNELRRVANIGEDVLQNSVPKIRILDTASCEYFSYTGDHGAEKRSHRCSIRDCVPGQINLAEDEQATPGADGNYPPTA